MRKIWFNQPANDWNVALPLGNGKLGAMVFGGTVRDQIALNEETMHMRPMEYLTYRRLGEAKNLLRHSSIPIADVGTRCGFPDAGYFSTVFKRHEGMSPAEYRKN